MRFGVSSRDIAMKKMWRQIRRSRPMWRFACNCDRTVLRLHALLSIRSGVFMTSGLSVSPRLLRASAARYPFFRKLRIPRDRKDLLSAGMEGRNVH